jgi:prephenate dehydrogenase
MILFERVAIIGVGLLGASLARALKERGLAGSIAGYGRNRDNLEKARKLGIIDTAASGLDEAVKDADLVVLCSPVGALASLTLEAASQAKPGCILTDVGSVKAPLIRDIEARLPESVYFVGAHPIAGGEKSGLDASNAKLFEGANCIVTPSATTNAHALDLVARLWRAVGMNVVVMDMDEHDEIFGAVSHLPHIIAFALMNTVGEFRTQNHDQVTSFSGAGLRDITRIAASDPVMWRDICLSNKKPILHLIDQFQDELGKLRAWIEAGEGPPLEEAIESSNKHRLNLV